jgi:hypothetical protein
MIAVCGMACEIYELKLEFKGCPILKRAVEKQVDYCLRCDSLPCAIHYRFNYPYSDFLLDSWKIMKEHRKDFGSNEF